MIATNGTLLRPLANGVEAVSDAALLDQYTSKRDGAAFAELARRHGPMVLRVCRSVLAHDADAEDAAQAAFLVLAEQAHRVRSRDALAAWLHGVALRTARRLRRSLARRRAVESRAASAPRIRPIDFTLRDALTILDEELDRLPDRHKAPLVLCYLEGKTHDEAAAVLDWPLAVFRGRLERARAKIRARLASRGVTTAAALLAADSTMPAPATGVSFAIAAGRVGSADLPPRVTALAHGTASRLSLAATAKAALATSVLLATAVMLALGGYALSTTAVTADPPPVVTGAVEPSRVPLAGKILAVRFDRFLTIAEDGSGAEPWGGELEEYEHVLNLRVAPRGEGVAYLHQTRVGQILSVWTPDRPWPGKVVQTPADGFIQNFFWMPDGRRLVLLIPGDQNDSDYRHRILDLATGRAAPLELPKGHCAADVSPDGSWYLTLRVEDPERPLRGGVLYRVDAATRTARKMADGIAVSTPPLWRVSPDGTHVAGLSLDREGRLQVFKASANGGNPRQITRETTHINGFGGWSPDGGRILYQLTREPGRPKEGDAYEDLYAIIRADGIGRTELLKHAGRFGPDGIRPGQESLGPLDWR